MISSVLLLSALSWSGALARPGRNEPEDPNPPPRPWFPKLSAPAIFRNYDQGDSSDAKDVKKVPYIVDQRRHWDLKVNIESPNSCYIVSGKWPPKYKILPDPPSSNDVQTVARFAGVFNPDARDPDPKDIDSEGPNTKDPVLTQIYNTFSSIFNPSGNKDPEKKVADKEEANAKDADEEKTINRDKMTELRNTLLRLHKHKNAQLEIKSMKLFLVNPDSMKDDDEKLKQKIWNNWLIQDVKALFNYDEEERWRDRIVYYDEGQKVAIKLPGGSDAISHKIK